MVLINRRTRNKRSYITRASFGNVTYNYKRPYIRRASTHNHKRQSTKKTPTNLVNKLLDKLNKKVYIEKDSVEKQRINNFVGKCVNNVLNKNGASTSVILLDGEMLRSTTKCLEYLSSSNITVVERERNTYDKMRPKITSFKGRSTDQKINLYHDDIDNHMKNTNEKHSFAFFDFMESKVRDSHITCFKNFIEKAPEYSIMAVTFSHRKSGTLKNHVIEIKNKIAEIAAKFNRQLCFGLNGVYKRSNSETDKRGCTMIYLEAFLGPWENIHEEWIPYICYQSKSMNDYPNMVWTRWYGYPDENDWTLEPIETMKQIAGVKWL